MEKSQTPIIDSIEKYLKEANFRFHTPGHRGGKNISKKIRRLKAFEWDITEVEGVGNLFIEQGPIYLSELKTAQIYNVQRTLFFTQGSSRAIHTALLAIAKKTKRILIPRNAHSSVINGLIISGLDPVWYNAKIDQNSFFEPFDVNEVVSLIEENKDIKAVFVQNPTYEGLSGDIKALAKYCQNNGIILIVDEAHGAHWVISDKLPISATKVNSDIIIQSPHKTLPAFTGAAYLHINNDKMIEPCIQSRRIIHSTSPSYLTLASLDSMNYYLVFEAEKLYEELRNISDNIVSLAKKLNNIEVIKNENNFDYTKINLKFCVKKQKVSDIFLKYGIIIEKWSGNIALFLLTPSVSPDEINCLTKALDEVSKLKYYITQNEKNKEN